MTYLGHSFRYIKFSLELVRHYEKYKVDFWSGIIEIVFSCCFLVVIFDKKKKCSNSECFGYWMMKKSVIEGSLDRCRKQWYK